MQIINLIEENRDALIRGHINSIPMPFKGIRKAFSGIFPGALVCVTAETSVGKTSLAKYLYLFSVADYILDDPSFSNFKYKCLWFGLEESEEEFDISILQYAISKYYNKHCTQDELLSRINPISDEIISMIKSHPVVTYFNTVKSFTKFDDQTGHATGIYKSCQDYSKEIGEHHYKEKTLANGKVINLYSHYTQEDPNQIVTVVIDNVNILELEKNELGMSLDLSGCIDKLVNSYMRKQVTKHWKWHVCCVQQQQMAAGDLNHYKAGKLEPEPQKLGDNIKVARSYQVIIGLFSPYKHKLTNYYKYQILNSDRTEGFEECFRTVHICKNRFGRTGIAEPVFFNPKGFSFFSMPRNDDTENLNHLLTYKKTILTDE
jgi:hypothetical protein